MARIDLDANLDTTELWMDGQFVASWSHINLDDKAKRIVCNMIEAAAEIGEQRKAKELRKALGLVH